MQVKKRSTTEDRAGRPTASKTKNRLAYEKIRKMIISGQFTEDTRWSIRTLAARLGISAAPVVAAIRQLEQEEILEVHPQRGINVKMMTLKEIQQAAIVREGLEVQAARLVAKSNDRTVIKTLQAFAKRIVSLLEQGKLLEAAYADFELHQALVQAARCDILIAHYERLATICMLSTRGWDYSCFGDQHVGDATCHMTLVDAIATGDADTAETAMRRHLNTPAD